jgi:tetratricopeptide (TPR) repeat protein
MLRIREEISEIKKKISIYISVGRYEAAEKLLKMSISEYGNIAILHNLLGLTFHRQSKFPEALEQFELAFKENPEFVEAKLNFSIALCDLGQYEKAQEVFEGLDSGVNPKFGQTGLVLGRLANHHAQTGDLYETCGMKSFAISEYKRALSLYPKMPDVKIKLARLYLETGDQENARNELESLKSIAPALEEAPIWLGILDFIKGRRTLAFDNWTKAYELNQKSKTSKAYNSLVRFLRN